MGKIEKQILIELREAGYNYRDVNKIFDKKTHELAEVDIILKYLPEAYKEHLGTGDILARSLIVATEPFDPSVLIDLYDNSELNDVIKDGIGNVLSYAPTYDISNWMRNKLLNEVVLFQSASLIPGLPGKGGFNTNEELIAFLQLIFDRHFSDYWIMPYKKYATLDDIGFLKSKLNGVDKKRDKEIEKLITAIRNKKRVNTLKKKNI
ncbi:hypothetical protein SIO70_17510 [Chitinophaga sancti]|uniref:hypothetical protein n=1 Tax=Chitinophaga sancti TaxID=1004 RepID=UPI002A764E0F|nr:hypothetical protein [Chitinophaga sancti]WPQ60141.1 hypothetical protein SIO70_17510 [Chitinophaga sancti]